MRLEIFADAAVDAAHFSHVELGLPHAAIHFRWQTLDILLNKSVIISISILAAVRRASAAGEVLLPPRNQDMVLSYVATSRGRGVWIDWRRVDGVSLRAAPRSATERRSLRGAASALCRALRCRTDVDVLVFRTIRDNYKRMRGRRMQSP